MFPPAARRGAGGERGRLRDSNPKINDPIEGARGDMIVITKAGGLEPVALKTAARSPSATRTHPRSRPGSRPTSNPRNRSVEAPGGKAKPLAVDVKVKDRSLRVRSRRTVVEKTAEARVRDRVLSNLFRSNASRACQLPSRRRAEKTRGKTTVSLTLSVPVAASRARPRRKESGAFSVFVASASSRELLDVTRQRQPFDVPRATRRRRRGISRTTCPSSSRRRGAHLRGVWDEVGREAGFLVVDVAGGKANAAPIIAPRVALVGPFPPWRSGIADQDQRLLNAMRRLGVDPLVVGFSRMYPEFLYPGTTGFSEGRDSLEGKRGERRSSSTALNPFSFVRAARLLSFEEISLVVLPWWTAYFAPHVSLLLSISVPSGPPPCGFSSATTSSTTRRGRGRTP